MSAVKHIAGSLLRIRRQTLFGRVYEQFIPMSSILHVNVSERNIDIHFVKRFEDAISLEFSNKNTRDVAFGEITKCFQGDSRDYTPMVRDYPFE